MRNAVVNKACRAIRLWQSLFGLGLILFSQPLRSQDLPEIIPQGGYDGTLASDYYRDGLASPNYLALFWDLTGLAAHVEQGRAVVSRSTITFSRSERDAIRSQLNALGARLSELTEQRAEILNACEGEGDSERLAALRQLALHLEEERRGIYQQVPAIIAPHLNATQRRQLKELGVGIILAHNTLQAIFEGAVEHHGFQLSQTELVQLLTGLRREMENLQLARAKAIRTGWDRVQARLPAGMREKVDKLYGLDVFDEN